MEKEEDRDEDQERKTCILCIFDRDGTNRRQARPYLTAVKLELLRKAEPFIETELLKPWISLKKKIQNVK
ncbi:hypothetical protein GBA52_003626 [Prunus armeniaca]|nr:hypothetical protein GBA52_003626 [Prunus armeniaca]